MEERFRSSRRLADLTGMADMARGGSFRDQWSRPFYDVVTSLRNEVPKW